MTKKTYAYSSGKVDVFFDGSFTQLNKIIDRKKAILITDENIFKAHLSQIIFNLYEAITQKNQVILKNYYLGMKKPPVHRRFGARDVVS